MKKFAVLAFAALLVFAFTVPATAEVEHQFGGYWRTRMYMNEDFSGLTKQNPDANADATLVDARTRLYYTAVLNENLKLVNKFEIDLTWGGPDTIGDIGADGKEFEIKNTYAEFTLEEHTLRVGVQGWTFQRGFLFADDGSGILWMYPSGNILHIAAWLKFWEGDLANHDDLDVYGYAPVITLEEGFTVQPYLVYAYSGNGDNYLGFLAGNDPPYALTGIDTEITAYYIGLDADQKTDAFSWWFTGIYQGGEIDVDLAGAPTVDISAYLAAFGGSMPFGTGDIHGQVFYATGQDPTETDLEAFSVFQGQSYYWSEILGYGIFDLQVPVGSPADKISNIMAANIGLSFKPNDKMTLVLDLWYAKLNEEILNTASTPTLEDDLGFEIDARLTTQLVEGLTLDLVAAYLSAGDAVGAGEEDPIEVGAQMSLSF